MIRTGAETGVPQPPAPRAPAALEPGDGLPTSERARLIRDGLVNYSGVLVSGIVGIAVVPTMLSHLGAESYGLWVVVLSIVVLLGEVDFGLSPVLTREVAADPSSPETARLVVTGGAAYLVLGVVGGAVVASLGTLLGGEIGLSGGAREAATFVFAMGGLLYFAGRGLAFALALLYGWRRFGTANALIAGIATITGAGTISILLGGGGIRLVAVWQAVVAGSLAAVALGLVVRLGRAASFRPNRPSWAALRPQVAFGLGSQILTVSINLLWFAAPTLVGLVSGSRLVASYDVGRKFPLALSMLSWRSSEAFFPTASRESRTGSAESRLAVLEAITRWNLVLVLPFSAVLLILAPNLLAVWLDSPPPHASIVFRLLVVAVFVDAFGVGALHVLWAAGKMRALLWILGATTTAGFAAGTLLLWQTGVAGIAATLAITMAVRSMLLLRTVSRTHGVTLATLLNGAKRGLALPLVACALGTYVLNELVNPHGWLGLVAVGVTGLGAYLVGLSLAGTREEERIVVGAAYGSLRRALRRIRPLRSAWYLAHELVRMAAPDAQPTASRFDREFQVRVDPWDYGRDVEQQRFQAATQMLDAAREARRFPRALEIGCAEGMFTVLLVPRCEILLAVDISSVALRRARLYLGGSRGVTLKQWDLLHDPQLGTFDLIVAMDVLDYIVRPSDLHRAQAMIRTMLPPGGLLLLSTLRRNDVFEKAWWRHWIRRGRMINEAFASLEGFTLVDSRSTPMHTLSLHQVDA